MKRKISKSRRVSRVSEVLKDPRLKRTRRRVVGASFFILLFVAWTFLIYYLSPEGIVDFVGIHNGYLLAFAIAFLGGTSILLPIPYYLVVFTLGAGGLNPILLGLFAGAGLMLGDSTSYFVGYSGREVMPERLRKWGEFLEKQSEKEHSWPLTIFLFIYGAMIPLPNDLVIVPLGIFHYGYKKTVFPVGLGNVIFNTMIAAAGYYGWGLFI